MKASGNSNWIPLTLLTANQLLALAAPYLVKVAIDEGIARGRADVLWWVGLGGLLIYGLAALTKFGGNWYTTKVGEELWSRERNRVFEHVQRLPYRDLKDRQVGELVARVYGDTFQLKQLVTSVMPAAINVIVGVGGAAVILLVLAPRLVLLALVPIPIGLLVMLWFRKYVRPLSKARMERHGHLYSSLHEGIAGAEEVRLLQAEEAIAKKVRARGDALKKTDLDLAWHRSRLGPMADFGISLLLLGTLVVGGQMAIAGKLSVGTVVVFYFYVGRCLGPIRGIPGMVYSWHSARAARERLDELLSIPPCDSEAKGGEVPTAGPLSITAKNVGFSYGEGNQALSDYCLEVGASERVAILGPSGVGKSTTARLLLGLLAGDKGDLLLQGIPIARWPEGEVRRRVGLVGQEVFLFEGTLRANLLLGLEKLPTEEELRNAVDAAGLREVIDVHPEGIELAVGPKGGRLSGGQKKRVALARALLRRPDLLIVDQMATDLEERLNEAIFVALRSRAVTLIYFGHRIPAGLAPDRVYWMESGRLRPYEPSKYEKSAPR